MKAGCFQCFRPVLDPMSRHLFNSPSILTEKDGIRLRNQTEISPSEMEGATDLIDQDRSAFLTQATYDTPLLSLARLFWENRKFIFRFAVIAASISLLLGILTRNSYRSTTQLMPPDSHGVASLAALAGVGSKLEGGGLGALAGDLLGIQSTGALFVAVLHSRTAEDD